MKVAFFTLSYKTVLYGSLINEFIDKGHEVIIITPTYEDKTKLVSEGGCKILFFKSLPMLNIGIIRKGIANLLLPYACMLGIIKFIKNENFDLIISTTPPIGFYSAIRYLKKRSVKAVFYLILRDIHPEGAKFIGLDRYKLIYSYFRKIEKNIYNLADYIGCMSPRNISFIAERNSYLDCEKLRLLPNWEPAVDYTIPNNEIKIKYDLENKFILLYGGNMGIAQNLQILLSLAEKKREMKDVLFLLIGKGTEVNKLKNRVAEMNLDNVRFMDFIPRSDYNDIMKLCDVGFISLHPNVPIPNIPSKTLGYFNAKLPILASVDPVTDYGEYIIDRSKAGLWSLATDINLLSENFDTLYNSSGLRSEMGENGYQYLKDNFNVTAIYNEIISKVCE